jgi:hypothetical protein
VGSSLDPLILTNWIEEVHLSLKCGKVVINITVKSI